MQELWQLYNEDQKPVPGKGATKDVVLARGYSMGLHMSGFGGEASVV